MAHRKGAFVCGIFVLDAQQKNKYMKEAEAGDDLVELVHYLKWLRAHQSQTQNGQSSTLQRP